MSDTPETDGELNAIKSVVKDEFMLETMADFARKLERERDELRNEIEGWRNKWECAIEMGARSAVDLDGAMQKNATLRYIAERALALAAINEENDKFGLVTELDSELNRLKEGATCDPNGREVLKFWNHDRYLSMSEILQEAEKQNKKRKKKDK